MLKLTTEISLLPASVGTTLTYRIFISYFARALRLGLPENRRSQQITTDQ